MVVNWVEILALRGQFENSRVSESGKDSEPVGATRQGLPYACIRLSPRGGDERGGGRLSWDLFNQIV